jgi:hypothetical protein
VRKSGRLNVVFVVKDGKVVPQRVKAGRTNYERIEISEGLRAGERVVVSGLSPEQAESLLLTMAAARGDRPQGGQRPPGAGILPGSGGGRGMR